MLGATMIKEIQLLLRDRGGLLSMFLRGRDVTLPVVRP